MAPPDSRKMIGGLCYAKAEAVSRDAKRIYGVLLPETWIPGTVMEVINHKADNAKRATTYIKAQYKIGNKIHEKSIPLQSLKAQAPEGPPTCATAEEAGVTTTTNENANPNTGDNGTAPAANVNNNNDNNGFPLGTGTPSPPPLGTRGTPPTPPTPSAYANDGRAWFQGDTVHDVNGPTTVKMWKMTCQ